jgi:hypothetical protein
MRIHCAPCAGITHARTTPYRGVRSMRAHSKVGVEMTGFDELFRRIEGEQIPGGCDRCDAYQTVEIESPGMHVIRIHHDDWCPVLKAMQAGEN